MFDLIDSDNSGTLTQKEVVLFLKAVTDDISDENIATIFSSLDKDGDKEVDYTEFQVDICINAVCEFGGDQQFLYFHRHWSVNIGKLLAGQW